MSVDETSFREHLIAFSRTVGAALVTTLIILAGLQILYGANQAQQLKIADQLARSNQATACILALPADPVTGRDPSTVQLCFTQYGLIPPLLHNP